MKLKKIELYGFKSFGQKTVLNFDHPVTVIVGPNGSGKSNIADAIRWVLGEQSAKSLRGGKMEDVIFGGTDQKKPLNLAQVSMLFDNSEKELDIAYEEVLVTRKLFRSGETSYSINKTNCRLKDIRSLFMDTGIGKDGYSMIGQGRIEELLSASDQDRRDLFEEATGISRFRYQIEESTRKLNKTNENLIRVKDIIASLEGQVSYLQREADKAKKGMRLTRDLEVHTIALYQQDMMQAEKLSASLATQLESLQIQSEEEARILEEQKSRLEPIRAEIAELAKEFEIAQNAEKEERRNTDQMERELGLSVQRSEFLKQDEARIRESVETFRNEKQKWQDRIDQLLGEESALRDTLAEEKQLVNELQNREEEITEEYEKNRQILHDLDESKIRIEKQLQQAELRGHAQRDAESFRSERSQQLRLQQQEEQTRLHELENRIQSRLRKQKELQSKIAELAEITEKNQEEVAAQKKVVEEKEDQLRIFRIALEKERAQLQTIEAMERNHEGYQKPVQILLQRAEKDPTLRSLFIGPLGALLEVESHVQTAVEIALGQAVHNIVTENGQQAKQLIEWLRKERIGRATFLPINQIKAFPYRGKWPEGQGVIGPATDFIRHDHSIRVISESLLGKTCIIENVDTGLVLRKNPQFEKLRFVTLDGDLLNPFGSMVGGFLHKERAGILSRETERKKLQTKEKETEEEVRNVEASIVHIQEEIRKTRALQQENFNLQEEYRSLYLEEQKQLATEEATRDVYSSQLQRIETLLSEMQTDREEEDFGVLAESLRKQVCQFEEKIRDAREKTESADSEKREVNSVLSLRVAGMDSKSRDLLLLENRRNDLIESLEEKEERYNKEAIQLQEILARSSQEEDTQNRLRESMREANRNADNLRLKIEKISKLLEITQKEAENVADQVRDGENSLLQTQKETDMTRIRLTNAKEKADGIVTMITDELDISQEEARTALLEREPVRTTRQRVRELRDALREIGPFSFDSIEQYESVQSRYTFLLKQSDDLKKSGEDLQQVIASLEKQMRRQFRSGMREINEKFLVIFRTLFDGGHAEIALVGEDILDAGIEIIACPPGKTKQTLSLLSGGEKALTAVALLFAIFETRPSPFCVLDEIDAALDDANIERYKQYLESFRGMIQFIIITHRKQTMELADVLYGVTMQENSTSQIIPLTLADKKVG